jgi:hypothetical protein
VRIAHTHTQTHTHTHTHTHTCTHTHPRTPTKKNLLGKHGGMVKREVAGCERRGVRDAVEEGELPAVFRCSQVHALRKSEQQGWEHSKHLSPHHFFPG